MPRCHDGFWASSLPSTQSPDECAHTLKRQRQGHHSHHHQKSLSGGATAKGELSWLRQTCLPPTLQLHNFIIIIIVVVLLLLRTWAEVTGPWSHHCIVLPCQPVSHSPLSTCLTSWYIDLCKLLKGTCQSYNMYLSVCYIYLWPLPNQTQTTLGSDQTWYLSK